MIQKNLRSVALTFLLTVCASPLSYGADDMRHAPTLNMTGEIGLNTMPSARMSPAGTLRFTLSRQSPYTHAAMGLQITDKLYLGLRQTAAAKSVMADADHLYPGLDAKLELFPEKRFLPQMSLGLQSALGHKRMAAEYLAMSKRVEDFDFTLGLGWGRLGTRGSLPNPIVLNHLHPSSDRTLDGENPNTPADWFKGDMGVFGGMEYHTPINGLSLKADWSSDAWAAEKQADPSFNAPAPWSVGVSYHPWNWMDAGIAYAGSSVMARVSLTPNVAGWPFTDARRDNAVPLLSGRPDTPDITDDGLEDDEPYDINLDTERTLGLSHILIDRKTATADLTLNANLSTPDQIGEAARYVSNMAGDTPEQIIFHLRHYGLKGTDIALNRADLERAFLHHQGSSEEIWHTTQFLKNNTPASLSRMIGEIQTAQRDYGFKLDIINDVSLSEEDSGLLYRTGIVAGIRKFFGRFFLHHQSVRLNIADNLENLNTYRGVSLLPVRGDIDVFTRNRVLLDREFLTGFATLGNDIHVASSVGYLEEMYMGLSNEILYRPFGKNWAVGVEAALAFKRDPYSNLALLPNGDHILSGFLNGYYEIPDTGATVKASIGRYLAGDVGGSLSLSNEFLNGVILKGDVTATNQSDRDIYGGKTNIYAGIHLSLPFGNLPFVPDGSRLITHAAPLGRDTAQRLDNPVSLYDMTEPLSYRHITRHWSQLMPAP